MSPARQRCLIGAFALLVAAVGGTAWAADGDWMVEGQLIDPVPSGGDGTLTPAAPVGVGPHVIDFQDGLTAAVAVRRQVAERFALALTLSLGSHDVELDVAGAGTIPLGSSDLMLLQLAGLFDVAEISSSSLKIGPVLAYADFDDVSVSGAARSRAGIDRATLGGDLLFGVEFRLETPIGDRGLQFTSTLRYLTGGPTLDVFTGGPGPAGSGSADFDPLIVGLGLGYRF